MYLFNRSKTGQGFKHNDKYLVKMNRQVYIQVMGFMSLFIYVCVCVFLIIFVIGVVGG